MELDIGKSANFKGYTALLQENVNPAGLGDLHEGFDIGWEPPVTPPFSTEHNTTAAGVDGMAGAMYGANVWPKDIPGFKEGVLTY
ncbi:hypothetical protein H0H87_007407 [Tephrocybe sp. NHM501043]|nr:hypothetical protein H0H87_007407 [Tephrocybe sp. NHM501043]